MQFQKTAFDLSTIFETEIPYIFKWRLIISEIKLSRQQYGIFEKWWSEIEKYSKSVCDLL